MMSRKPLFQLLFFASLLSLTMVTIAILLSGVTYAWHAHVDEEGISYEGYYIRLEEETADIVTFGIYSEIGGTRELLATMEALPADEYIGGVSSDGEFIFLVGYNPTDPMEETAPPMNYIYIYSSFDLTTPIFYHWYNVGYMDMWDFFFFQNKLYRYVNIDTTPTLEEIDLTDGTIKQLVSGENISVHPQEGCVYYTRKAPRNEEVLESAFAGVEHGVMEPVDCSCCGGLGYYIYKRYDLSSGAITEPFTASASSTLQERGKPEDYLGAQNVLDGDITTAWAEGVEGPGIGESLTIYFGVELEIDEIGILPGFAKNPEVYFGNNRLKKVRIEFSDGTNTDWEFSEEIKLQFKAFEDHHLASWMKITILDVYPGTSWDDTCISEISINAHEFAA